MNYKIRPIPVFILFVMVRENPIAYIEILRYTALRSERQYLDLTGISLGGRFAASKTNAIENITIAGQFERSEKPQLHNS